MAGQRNDRRLDFLAEADVGVDGNTYRCDLVDLALQGALFRSKRELPLSLGTQVPLNIYLSDTSMRMKFVGELIHHSGNFYGFIFTTEDSESMGQLSHFLEQHFGDTEQLEGQSCHWLKRGPAG